MNYIIAKLVFLIILFLVLIIVDKNKEKFSVSELLNNSGNNLGFFSIVNYDDTTTDGYDLDKFGPHCVAQCVAEHGANLLFTNPDGLLDPFDWNKKNPTKGYCYRANSNEYPFGCDGQECKNKCGVDTNNPRDNNGEYDPEKDFSQCDDDEDGSDAYLGCKERKLNFLSGQSCMTTVGCKKCIDKYKKNLYSLKGVIHDDYLKTKTCEVNSNNSGN